MPYLTLLVIEAKKFISLNCFSLLLEISQDYCKERDGAIFATILATLNNFLKAGITLKIIIYNNTLTFIYFLDNTLCKVLNNEGDNNNNNMSWFIDVTLSEGLANKKVSQEALQLFATIIQIGIFAVLLL